MAERSPSKSSYLHSGRQFQSRLLLICGSGRAVILSSREPLRSNDGFAGLRFVRLALLVPELWAHFLLRASCVIFDLPCQVGRAQTRRARFRVAFCLLFDFPSQEMP